MMLATLGEHAIVRGNARAQCDLESLQAEFADR
jgi:hypothetical protein